MKVKELKQIIREELRQLTEEDVSVSLTTNEISALTVAIGTALVYGKRDVRGVDLASLQRKLKAALQPEEPAGYEEKDYYNKYGNPDGE